MNASNYGLITKHEGVLLGNINQIDKSRRKMASDQDFLYSDIGNEVEL